MFKSLKLYTVHVKPGAGSLQEPLLLREGFNIFAFAFGIIWAIYHRCYYFAALIFVTYFALGIAIEAGVLSELSAFVTQIAISLMIGFHANDAWRYSLRKRGYIMQDIVSGESIARAGQRYFDRISVQGV